MTVLGGEIGAALAAIENGAKRLRTAWMVRGELNVQDCRELITKAVFVCGEAETRSNPSRPEETR